MSQLKQLLHTFYVGIYRQMEDGHNFASCLDIIPCILTDSFSARKRNKYSNYNFYYRLAEITFSYLNSIFFTNSSSLFNAPE